MLMIDLEGLVLGDELLIDGSPYTGKGMEWARLTHVSPGSASTYPSTSGAWASAWSDTVTASA